MIKSVGKIFLAGGGSAEEERPILSAFLSEIEKPKILYVPLALDPDTDIFKNSPEWIRETVGNASVGKEAEIRMVLNIDDAMAYDFNAIFIGGGNTFRLATTLKKTGLDKIITESFYNNIPIYGGSAGAIICGKYLDFAKSDPAGFKDSAGLDLLNGFSCCCHYIEQDQVKIRGRRPNTRVIALSENSGALFDGKRIVSCNKEPVIIYTDALKETAIQPGEGKALSELM